MRRLVLPGAVALLLGAAGLSTVGEAHKAITSRFTYNADVYPIFATRCSHCHVAGGVGPMSLVTYQDAFPWAESLRAELTEPASGESFVDTAHTSLTARELDVVLDWAVGGTPEGSGTLPSTAGLKNDWAGEPPDLVLTADAFTMPADAMDLTKDFSLPSHLDRDRRISAVDLLPGNPAIVRDVAILVHTGTAAPRTIATWTPRQTPAALAVPPGTMLPSRADVVLHVRYKKTWKYEGQTLTDQSRVGFYFADK